MGRILSQKTFRITPSIVVEAVSEDTRSGFRHLADVFKDGIKVGHAKVTYLNRTWESYEFQTVLRRAINGSSLTPEEKKYALKWIEGDRTDWSGFQMTGQIAKLGDIFGKTEVEKNIWKKRMLKAGLGAKGLDFPEDWEKLPEKTKKARLDKVINMLSAKKTKAEKEAKKIEKKIKKIAGI